jgi:hypothetical protein
MVSGIDSVKEPVIGLNHLPANKGRKQHRQLSQHARLDLSQGAQSQKIK